MRYQAWLTGLVVVLVAGPALGQAPHDHHGVPTAPSLAEDGPAEAGPHGGSLKKVGNLQLETVVEQGGLRMYAFDTQGAPVAVDQARGAAVLRVEGYAKRYRYDLLPDGKGGLMAPVNLSQVAGRQLEIDVQLVGINAAGLRFQEVAVVPMSESQLAAAAIARQRICPVSGKPLGSMGEPVSVEVGDQQVFVCCAGCVGTVEANPEKFAAGRPEIRVAEAKAEDRAAIAKQKLCPVMDEPLGSMGMPIKVSVGDKPIFLCCKGCIKKVKAEPAKYLAKVYGNFSANAHQPVGDKDAATAITVTLAKTTEADAAAIAKQKLCPVMDEPLGSMGGPIKLMVDDKPIFLCCKGCIKRVKAEPAKYLAKVHGKVGSVPAGTEEVRSGIFKVAAADAPFIAAQKQCPVMEEPLDAMGGPYKVNANGKAIYICCPGCAKRIAADPQKYLEVLASQGVSAPLIR